MSRWFTFVQHVLASALIVTNVTAQANETDSIDYCADVQRNRDGRPLSALPSANESLVCTTNQRVTLQNSITPAIQRIEHGALMEKLRLAILEQSLANRMEANWIQHCFASTPKESPLYEIFANSDSAGRAAMDSQCWAIHEIYRKESESIPETRQLLALRSPRLLARVESKLIPLEQKIHPDVPHPHFHFAITLEKLTPAEAKQAEATYDAWLNEAMIGVTERKREEFIEIYRKRYPNTPPEEIQKKSQVQQVSLTPKDEAQLQRFIESKRKEVDLKYKKMLQDHPFLAHITSPESSDKAIFNAAKHLSESTVQATFNELDAMKKNPFGDEALALLSVKPLVRSIVAENPELCAAANRMTDYASSRQTGATIIATARMGVISLACMAFPIAWLECLGSGATISTGMEWLEARKIHHLKSELFHTAVTEDKTLLQVIDDLDPAEREMATLGLMTVIPYELGVGFVASKAPHAAKIAAKTPEVAAAVWKSAYEASPRVREAVSQVAHKAHISSKELLNRISEHIKQKAVKP